jgi:hypothetical protein
MGTQNLVFVWEVSMEKESEAEKPFWNARKITLAIALAIVALSCFRVGYAFAIYLRDRDAHPPAVEQGVPYAPSASIGAEP